MKAVGRFFGLFFLEWVLDMAICVVAMFSLGVLMMLIISVFGPNHIEVENTIFYESINILGVISFVIIINLSRSWNQLIIHLIMRSIVLYFYFNIYLSIFLISIPAIIFYGLIFISFFDFLFFSTQTFDWFSTPYPNTFWFLVTLPFVVSTLTAPYIIYRWKGEVFESRFNRKFRAQLQDKERIQSLTGIKQATWWENGIGPNENLLDFCRKRFRKRSNE